MYYRENIKRTVQWLTLPYSVSVQVSKGNFSSRCYFYSRCKVVLIYIFLCWGDTPFSYIYIWNIYTDHSECLSNWLKFFILYFQYLGHFNAGSYYFSLKNRSCFPGLLSKNLNYLLNVGRLVSITLFKMMFCLTVMGN